MNQDLKQYAQLHDENIELKKEIERLKKDIETQRLRANSYRLKGYKLSDELRKLKNEPDIPDIKIVKSQIEGLKSEMEWISVKDRLPEIRKDYLVTDGCACMVAEFMIKSQEWNFFGISWWSNGDVTHWMPLPNYTL